VKQYYLLKELAPNDQPGQYWVAEFDNQTKGFKVLFFEETEDKARSTHHRMLFGNES